MNYSFNLRLNTKSTTCIQTFNFIQTGDTELPKFVLEATDFTYLYNKMHTDVLKTIATTIADGLQV